jgi:hypothetical protein
MSLVTVPLTNQAGEIAVNPAHVSWVLPTTFPDQATLYMDGGQYFLVNLSPRGLMDLLGGGFVTLSTGAPPPGDLIYVNPVQTARVEPAGTQACSVLAGGVKQQVIGSLEQVLAQF